jgi:hypothetical protein
MHFYLGTSSIKNIALWLYGADTVKSAVMRIDTGKTILNGERSFVRLNKV